MNKKWKLSLAALLLMLSATSLEAVRIETNASAQRQKQWALIVSGSHLTNFRFDAAYMYHVLGYHYSFDGIYYLATSVDEGWPGVNGTSTKENVRNAITEWLASHSSSNDLVFVFFTDHGGGYDTCKGAYAGGRTDGSSGDPVDEGEEIYDSTSGKWFGVDECFLLSEGPEEKYWDDELKADLATVQYSVLIFSYMACYSGGFIDDLSAPNRIIMTCANETHTGCQDRDGDLFCEWPESFIDALHGEDTTWNRADPNSYGIIHTGYRIDADSNSDGFVSIWEAWQYAWAHDDGRISGEETPWIDDNGNGLPTHRKTGDSPPTSGDVLDPTDGPLSAATRLRSALRNFGFEDRGASVYECLYWVASSGQRELRGDINGDCKIDIFDVTAVSAAYGSTPGQPNWNPKADLNGDQIIDIFDIVIVTSEYGKTNNPLQGSYTWKTNTPQGQTFTTKQTIQETQWLKGRSVTFTFRFRPDSAVPDGSLNYGRAKLRYINASGEHWVIGEWVKPAQCDWYEAYVTASLPKDLQGFEVYVEGCTAFKACLDLAMLIIDG